MATVNRESTGSFHFEGKSGKGGKKKRTTGRKHECKTEDTMSLTSAECFGFARDRQEEGWRGRGFCAIYWKFEARVGRVPKGDIIWWGHQQGKGGANDE